ncbi:MAG: hypothetical protein ABJA71_11720 [Ginsengibacter sp.]
MKKYFYLPLTAAFSLLFSLFFIGCIKDTCHKTYAYTYYVPIYKTKDEVKANIKSNAAKEVQNPGKIFTIGKYIFLNEIDKGIHIIDNSDPVSPQNVAFIDIPGNMDLALKGNILYADAYADLVTIDIANPLNVIVKKYNEGVFPFRNYGTGFMAADGKMIIDWQKRDTTITEACSDNNWMMTNPSVFFLSNSSIQDGSSSKVSMSPIGQGGSMARFALINNYLYTVSDYDLNIFNITNSVDPTFISNVQVDWHVETIYPFKNKLFIGSNNGMFIYDVESSPDNPAKMGEFTHVRACDPVIADDSFAFVTLHSGTECLGYSNQLDVVKLNDLTNSELVKTYSMTSPHGLSKDGNLLFICDGTDGLKVYDAGDVMNLQLIKQISNLETYDVIAFGNIALVVAVDGLYQYDYSNINNIHLLSKISIIKP